MSQENVPNKPVHLIYLCGGLLLFFLLQWTTDWIWGYFTRSPDEFYITVGSAIVALGTGIYLYRHEQTYALVNEVASSGVDDDNSLAHLIDGSLIDNVLRQT